MTILNLEAYARPEPRNCAIATKVTKSDERLIRHAVDALKDNGVEGITVSSFMAMAAVTTAKAVMAEQEAM